MSDCVCAHTHTHSYALTGISGSCNNSAMNSQNDLKEFTVLCLSFILL